MELESLRLELCFGEEEERVLQVGLVRVSSQRWQQVDGFGFAVGGFDFCMIQFASQFLMLDGLSGSQFWAAEVTTMELAGNFSASRESEHTIILYNVL